MNVLRRAFQAGMARLGGERARRDPREEGSFSLRELPAGCGGRVAALAGGHGLVARLAALGLIPGAEVVVAQNPGRGPVIVLVRDTRLVLGRGEAAHVLLVPAEGCHGGHRA